MQPRKALQQATSTDPHSSKKSSQDSKEPPPYRTCRQAFTEFKILAVVNLYILETVLFLKSPEATRTVAQNASYNTRNSCNYQIPIHESRYDLPEYLKKTNRLQFGRLLKFWIQDHLLFHLNEFY
uniref:Uncharacterized protein n=1 Tax=Homalodisca liturata TaxID=320908 RepID=A0A1B6IW44_9HEMI